MNMYKLVVIWLPQDLNAYCSKLDVYTANATLSQMICVIVI